MRRNKDAAGPGPAASDDDDPNDLVVLLNRFDVATQFFEGGDALDRRRQRVGQ